MKSMNAAHTAAKQTAGTRRALNERLLIANKERAALCKVRGPLGHGVIYHADKEAKMAALDAEMATLRCQLAALV